MLILGERRFIETSFDDEGELERVVVENAEYIFGPSCLFLAKAMIRTGDGAGTIPDGFAIDLATRTWYVVEAELNRHNVWSHIAPQVSKQLIASVNPLTKQLITDNVCERARTDQQVMELFADQEIEIIDIRRVLAEILEKRPLVAMPIDSVSNDLREWAATLRAEVKLWLIRKHVEFGQPGNVMYEFPEEFRPTIDTSETDFEHERAQERYEVSLADLLRVGLLQLKQELIMPYKVRGTSDRKLYTAVVGDNGTLHLLGKSFDSPSIAALHGINDAGSTRRTVNGWTAWRVEDDLSLADLREQYLSMQSKNISNNGDIS